MYFKGLNKKTTEHDLIKVIQLIRRLNNEKKDKA